jgi:hypothetical protein
MNLEQLTALEYQWLHKQHSCGENRETLYKQLGVYAAWQDIFRQYVALAGQGDIEALKRALYLAWTQRSQGPILSGVEDLDRELIRELLGIADDLARTGGLDAELQWMLPYYYLIEPSYIEQFEGFEALRQVNRQDPFLYRQACLKSSFDNRGHMGEYWKSKQAILRQWPYPRPNTPHPP